MDFVIKAGKGSGGLDWPQVLAHESLVHINPALEKLTELRNLTRGTTAYLNRINCLIKNTNVIDHGRWVLGFVPAYRQACVELQQNCPDEEVNSQFSNGYIDVYEDDYNYHNNENTRNWYTNSPNCH